MTVINVSRNTELGRRIRVADGWWSRLRGLLGRPDLVDGEGLMLTPCKAVHMHGMQFAIDVAFVDRYGTVLATYHSLQPGDRSGWHSSARAAIELPAGTLQRTGTREGDRVTWHPAREAAA